MSKQKKPYMAFYRRFVPKDNVDTRQKGWAKEGLRSIERYDVVDRISNRINREAIFILDILDLKAVKNSTGVEKEVALNYYCRKYSEEIGKAVQHWLTLTEGQNAEA